MNDYATLEDMAAWAAWAAGVMIRQPDFIVGENYLRRWFVVPRNPFTIAGCAGCRVVLRGSGLKSPGSKVLRQATRTRNI